MSDKAEFVTRALFLCPALPRNLELASTSPTAGRELICIYMRPQIVLVFGTMV